VLTHRLFGTLFDPKLPLMDEDIALSWASLQQWPAWSLYRAYPRAEIDDDLSIGYGEVEC